MKKIFLFLIFSFFVFSCSDTAPLIDQARAIILYDYENAAETPKMRLGLYVQLKSQALRAESLTLRQANEGLVWRIENPQSIYDEKTGFTWLGSSNLVPAAGSSFAPGDYRISYTDKAARKTEIMLKIPAMPAAENLNKGVYSNRYIAIFNAIGGLLYYEKNQNFLSDADIRQLHPDAAFVRGVLVSDDSLSAVLEPPRFIAEEFF